MRIMLGVMVVMYLSNSYAADAELKRFITASDYDVKKHGALYNKPLSFKLPLEGSPRCHTLAVHPDGSEVAIGASNGTLTIVNVDRGDSVCLAREARPIMSLSYVPVGIVCGRAKEAIYFKTTKTDSLYSYEFAKLAQLPSKVLILKTQFQQGELVTGSEDGAYTMWDVTTGKVKRALVQAAAEPATALAYLSDNLISVGAADNTIAIYDVRADKPTKNLKNHTALVNSLAYDVERKRLLSGSYDGTIAFWGLRYDYELCGRSEDEGSPISAVASVPLAQTWSEDQLLYGSMSGVVWHSNGVKNHYRPKENHKARVTAVAASDRLQVSVGYDGCLMLYGMLTKKMLNKFYLQKDEDCVVCLEPLQQAKDRVALACSHHFHSACITPWLAKSGNCPNCRAPHVGEPLALYEEEGEGEASEKGEKVDA